MHNTAKTGTNLFKYFIHLFNRRSPFGGDECISNLAKHSVNCSAMRVYIRTAKIAQRFLESFGILLKNKISVAGSLLDQRIHNGKASFERHIESWGKWIVLVDFNT